MHVPVCTPYVHTDRCAVSSVPTHPSSTPLSSPPRPHLQAYGLCAKPCGISPWGKLRNTGPPITCNERTRDETRLTLKRKKRWHSTSSFIRTWQGNKGPSKPLAALLDAIIDAATLTRDPSPPYDAQTKRVGKSAGSTNHDGWTAKSAVLLPSTPRHGSYIISWK